MGDIQQEHIAQIMHKEEYLEKLKADHRTEGTIRKYIGDVEQFVTWLGDRELDRDTAQLWPDHLLSQNYSPVTIQTMVSAVNIWLRFIRRGDCRIKFAIPFERKKRTMEDELTLPEVDKLLDTARRHGATQAALIVEIISSTGLRPIEFPYLTMEALAERKIEIPEGEQVRVVPLPEQLCESLRRYADDTGVFCGPIVLTRLGTVISKRQMNVVLTTLAEKSQIDPDRVSPLNLRRLFARMFYLQTRDTVRLAEILGIKNRETINRYIASCDVRDTVSSEEREEEEEGAACEEHAAQACPALLYRDAMYRSRRQDEEQDL